ncbi:hypothetical protein EUGRSUZ_C00519 [Eucalyptus grandis]|uniref:DUF4283 domain-containing protein n=2 Tax=Eucalyptus grandis TaxID=71139 RepID=A0A059CL30_EUCGR|nr:hypothetical protein EUGRSUZ_C00519 [Eucalyptus grandis]
MFGQLFYNPNNNLQAFQNTMEGAWRVDSVTLDRVDSRTLAFTFKSENEMNKILETRPWSFSSIPLVLKPWTSTTSQYSYDYTHYKFWVQVHRLPTDWVSEETIRQIAAAAGLVTKVKIDTKGFSSYTDGKAE